MINMTIVIMSFAYIDGHEWFCMMYQFEV